MEETTRKLSANIVMDKIVRPVLTVTNVLQGTNITVQELRPLMLAHAYLTRGAA